MKSKIHEYQNSYLMMSKTILKITLVTLLLTGFSCSKDDDSQVLQNNSPVISNQTFTVAENIADNIAIGLVEASDPDGDTLVFSISTNDENLFEINDNGLLSLDDLQTLDFETTQSHSITVAVSDGSTTTEAIITINVTDIDDTSFVTTWETSSANETLTIPTRADEFTYDYTIDWGDGNIQTGITGDAVHTYTNAGTYTVSINGTFPAIVLDDNMTSGDQLRSVERWGNIQWQTMERAFAGVNTLTINSNDAPNLSQVTNMVRMFLFTINLSGNFNTWDVSNVTNMNTMFLDSQFNEDISAWDVSNVTNMSSMFNFSQFNQDISAWNVSDVTNMLYMFADSSFNQDLSTWNVSNVTNMSDMFRGTPFNQDISNWNVTNTTNMRRMFEGAPFNQDISNWNVANVTNCSDFSLNAPLTSANTPNFTNCTP